MSVYSDMEGEHMAVLYMSLLWISQVGIQSLRFEKVKAATCLHARKVADPWTGETHF